MNDADYMRMALELAARGAGRVSPNPMVGAVVVKDHQVLGRGYHHAVGGPHAEVHALDEAGENARDATLYVTLEPCHHQGRTPPCTGRILEAGIRRVVAAMEDPNPDVTGGGNDFLRSRGVDVECGICRREALKLNESFVKFMRQKRPFVVLKLAATLDGCLATRTGDARWVTGPEARARGHQLRHQMDAIMVGAGTVSADDPRLTTRLEVGEGKDPIRIILDTGLRLPADRKVFNSSSPVPTWLVCGPDVDKAAVDTIQARGIHVLPTPLKNGRIDLNVLMETLGGMNVTSLLIEGGGQVAGSALAADIVDKIVFFYAPKILGGNDGIPMFGGSGPDLMRDALDIDHVRVSRVGADIMVEGYRHNPETVD